MRRFNFIFAAKDLIDELGWDAVLENSEEIATEIVTNSNGRNPKAFICPYCDSRRIAVINEAVVTLTVLIKCRDCRRKYSLFSKTAFRKTQLEWVVIFKAAMMLAKDLRTTASEIKRRLDINYETALSLKKRLLTDSGISLIEKRGRRPRYGD